MAKQIINIGSSEQAGDGESLRSAFDKINDNFDELYLKDTSDFDGQFSSLAGTPTTLAGYGITDAATTAQGALAATAVQPQTSLSGYGITDAYTKAEVDSEIATATSSLSIQSGSTHSIDIVAADSTVLVDSVNGTLNATTLTGALPAIDGSSLTGVLTGSNTGVTNYNGATLNFVSTTFNGLNFSDLGTTPTTIAGYGITDAFDGAFASLTSTPTTIAGYGITDALELGTTSTTALAGDTALFSGDYDDLSNKPTIPTAYTDSDVDTHLNTGSAGSNEVLSWDGADYAWVAQSGGGSGLQSRSSVTGTTGSLADAAEADLDITGFKSYALLTITTDRAARVRLYVSAATRTADASRAECVDPTSDAGLIAEVITTGADTVIISPGAYGFNLESSPTTTIPCRVTNKSGGTSTVQVDLNILQLEA
jgi:hypothetical protein